MNQAPYNAPPKRYCQLLCLSHCSISIFWDIISELKPTAEGSGNDYPRHIRFYSSVLYLFMQLSPRAYLGHSASSSSGRSEPCSVFSSRHVSYNERWESATLEMFRLGSHEKMGKSVWSSLYKDVAFLDRIMTADLQASRKTNSSPSLYDIIFGPSPATLNWRRTAFPVLPSNLIRRIP